MKRFTFFILKILACVLVILLLAEVILRAQAYTHRSAAGRAYFAFIQDMRQLEFASWLDQHSDDPFVPPLLVYSDRDSGDASRIQSIFLAEKLPPSHTWVSHDFLQSKAKEALTTFTVHSNALGFRGADNEADKPKGVFRVIVLGSYQAFGYAVNDNETYPYFLEKKLQADMPGRKIEVWNAGHYTGTAILGLARMQNDIFMYKPDLIVLDYGFIDAGVFDDNSLPLALRFPDSLPYRALRVVLYPFSYILGHSFLVNDVLNKVLQHGIAARTEEFHVTMLRMLDLADEHKVPVILVREPDGMPSFPKDLTDRAVAYVEVPQLFKEHPPQIPSEADRTTDPFWKRSWVADLPPNVIKFNPNYPYYLNYIQLNSRAYAVIANALATKIELLIHKP